jgi:hypothetical protein
MKWRKKHKINEQNNGQKNKRPLFFMFIYIYVYKNNIL